MFTCLPGLGESPYPIEVHVDTGTGIDRHQVNVMEAWPQVRNTVGHRAPAPTVQINGREVSTIHVYFPVSHTWANRGVQDEAGAIDPEVYRRANGVAPDLPATVRPEPTGRGRNARSKPIRWTVSGDTGIALLDNLAIKRDRPVLARIHEVQIEDTAASIDEFHEVGLIGKQCAAPGTLVIGADTAAVDRPLIHVVYVEVH